MAVWTLRHERSHSELGPNPSTSVSRLGNARNQRGLITAMDHPARRVEGVPGLTAAPALATESYECDYVPAIIARAGHGARFAFEEFFHARIRNAHTRRAYRRAVLCFLNWSDLRGRQLQQVSPADVGTYLDELKHSVASKKQILA